MTIHHKWIMHIDMDAYFAAVEQRDHPAYRNQPVIIGGNSGRGVVATASYEARQYGIRSAMSIAEAHRRCPTGIFLPPNMKKYVAVSKELRHIFEEFSPTIEPLSLDEAFLDITGMEYLYPDIIEIARHIKHRIKAELDLTASAGIATNKFLAKLASDLEKPDGLVIVRPGQELDLLAPMPVTKLWGVGHATSSILKNLHINTIADIRDTNIKFLEQHVGTLATQLYHLAWGRDDRPIIPDRESQSIGSENTFEKDLQSREQLQIALLSLTEKLGWRLRKAGLSARTITIKIRFASFQTITRSITLPSAISLDDHIYKTALEMAKKITLNEGIRLVGITASKLGQGGIQLSLFDNTANERQEKITTILDTLKDRFGEKIITRGRTL